MLRFVNGGRLVQSVSDLPNLAGAEDLFIDFETTSGDPKQDSLNPWNHCGILGVCIAVDNIPGSWYIPIRHTTCNLDRDAVFEWLRNIFRQGKRWINHNVKYDALVAYNDGVSFYNCELVDTVTLAKIINSDMKYAGGYSLSNLSYRWLEEDVTKYEGRLKAYLKGCKSRDYGDIPADIMAEYGCQDAITERKLWKYISRRMPEQCHKVRDTEIKLTSVLFDMEVNGLRVEDTELQIQELKATSRLLELEEIIHERTGAVIRPHVNADCYDLLCNQHGLPVLGFTEKGDPSFDKHAVANYLRHPKVIGTKLQEIVELILEHRPLNTLNNMFIKVFQQLSVNGHIHPNYNQSVTTGRMSCSKPNAQQQTYESKLLIHCPYGRGFLSADYSQVEFRLIVHYINNPHCIAAYAENPDMDFHTWVADMCGIPRKPAKNVNFAMGYGGGKARVLEMLAGMTELMEEFADDVEHFDELCEARALNVYNEYHQTLPELKKTTYRAARNLKSRGYVFNAYGRWRKLPVQAAFRSFNTVVQSTAADIMKEATVATSPRFNSDIKAAGVLQHASVHDETLFSFPEYNPDTIKLILKLMENPSVGLRVPLKVDVGWSRDNWASAAKNSIDKSSL